MPPLTLCALALLGIGCESQADTGSASGGVSTARYGFVREFVSQGVREYEAEQSAGSGAERDEPIANEDNLDADAGFDPFADERTLSDDSVRCGDGLLAEDELCDISIAAGEEGACPSFCEPAPGCPEQILIVRSCWTRCAEEGNQPPPAGCGD